MSLYLFIYYLYSRLAIQGGHVQCNIKNVGMPPILDMGTAQGFFIFFRSTTPAVYEDVLWTANSSTSHMKTEH